MCRNKYSVDDIKDACLSRTVAIVVIDDYDDDDVMVMMIMINDDHDVNSRLHSNTSSMNGFYQQFGFISEEIHVEKETAGSVRALQIKKQ